MAIQPPPTIKLLSHGNTTTGISGVMRLLFVGFGPVGKCQNKPHFE